MRLRTFKNKEIYDEYPNIIRDESSKGSLNKLFGNDNPIHLEVGCGMGKFIRAMAIKYPDINFIGLEKFDNVIFRAIDRSEVLPNLYFIKIDALDLPLYLGREIDEIYLNFSDPWPKKKHIKRRLTSLSFLEVYEKIAKKDLVINLKTDNRKFFEYSVMSLNNNSFSFEEISLDLHADKTEIITTEYEDKFLSKGENIYYLRGVKKL